MIKSNLTLVCVFLRGVMPVGKNKLPIVTLRQLLTEAGFNKVTTWIQSGNVVVETDMPLKEVEQAVHRIIKDRAGPDLSVIARTNQQLQQVLDNNPFTEGYDISRVFYTLFQEPPQADKVELLMQNSFGEEKLVVSNNEAYMYIPGSAARSKLSNNMLEKNLGVAATTRNYNTMHKMLELSKASKS